MYLDNLLDERQADPGALEPISWRQRLEHLEYGLKMLLLYAGPVVGDTEFPDAVDIGAVDLEVSGGLVPLIFYKTK